MVAHSFPTRRSSDLGGLSTTGRKRIMDIKPTDLHQRVPVVLGSKSEVERLTVYHNEFAKADAT